MGLSSASGGRRRKASETGGETVLGSARALMTKLDGDPKVRAGVLARIVKAAEKSPVVLLHQVAIMLEMNNGEG